ncbi:helix-turn-helix domain-containing protein [Pseudomonas sp. NKUCC02_KPG]|uniref:helix-turn-helix domain-containing protein n=1 Tax=Pseudomonas sp. NKUCC02_KPG TaxID=2842124 RepID=UPI001C5BC10A|nr:helix-turn-helix domain-containing protein [Pseudomonas sp. NKUCC02_KPG]MBW3505723.1 helix-turn-helix domain-containing protein [Pseudomonas sp. NKUCC02_KPG]
MSGKKATPDQNTQAVILREAGYTLPAIASRLELSISTVQRIVKTNKAVAGASTQALVEKAREEMLNAAYALEQVQRTAAALVLDDLAISQQIRAKLSECVDQIDPADSGALRALAASATTLKLTQDVTRRALPLEKLNMALDIEELPELQIHIMSEYDVAKMRAEQRREEAEINGDGEAMEDEIETLHWLEHRQDQQNKTLMLDNDDIITEYF